ncbi:MAG: cob(I)yrinic acid a,c-diamide adenosyltransferase [Bacteroidetes bacterium HGW-Bacteroidetes-10]|jgi:cob(I)alamin adenosyltransferase|nr:MAG: cob(I)yrinic acid a,c-diamide adenosyltransferase [Bacteroidetes bacterium HGW-Bacteroidetes-10]
MNKTGLVHIYTGDGKGKTTSAVGLAVRALGSGFKVCYVSFHKRPELYGYAEMNSLRKLGATVINIAKGHPHLDSSIDKDEIAQQVKSGMQMVSDLIKNEDFNVLILDEIIISVRDNYYSEEELIFFIDHKPESLELIITGRGATQSLIDHSDYTSKIVKVCHPYDKGIKSRKGIEF